MPSVLNPYLMFPGTAREAMTFYKVVFGGDLKLSSYSDFPGADEALAGKIMHGQLETTMGFTLMGADEAPGTKLVAGNNFAVSLSGDDEPDLRSYWTALAADGEVTVALEKQMWGDTFGQVTDKYGTTWMINILGS